MPSIVPNAEPNCDSDASCPQPKERGTRAGRKRMWKMTPGAGRPAEAGRPAQRERAGRRRRHAGWKLVPNAEPGPNCGSDARRSSAQCALTQLPQ